MLSLDELSRIGFGCHLVSDDSQEHYDAMLHALRSGCNLFDTSANYVNGKSEQLIGRVLRENSGYDAFIVTKSGYDEKEELEIVKRGAAENNLLHPEFLRNRIELSLSRLQRAYVDGYLLHSPEMYLEQLPNQDQFYNLLRRAFEFLEEEVARGVIRYYGLSSNTFNLPLSEKTTINLHRVLEVARSVSFNRNFKLIEFPFNLTETGAAVNHHGGTSLLALAKANGLVTLSNRPLNAKTPEGALRLAIYDQDVGLSSDARDPHVFDDCLRLMRAQILRIEAATDVMEFPIVRHLKDNWMKIGNPEAVEQIFHGYLDPFLVQLYEGEIPPGELAVYQRLYDVALRHSRIMRAHRTAAFHQALLDRGVIRRGDERPLPVVACETYLNYGLDHVLVGMRRRKYVDEMKVLF